MLALRGELAPLETVDLQVFVPFRRPATLARKKVGLGVLALRLRLVNVNVEFVPLPLLATLVSEHELVEFVPMLFLASHVFDNEMSL